MRAVLIDKEYFSKHLIDNSSIEVLENTQFIIDFNSLLDISEISIEFIFNKPEVNAHVIGIYSIEKETKLTTNLRATHNVENTTCLIDIKGVLYNKSFSNHQGEIFIGKNAFGTESYLNDHTLLLGDLSKTISMPNLRIHNNDVKASHGASIGSVNKEKIYYLQSRGFSEKYATNILVSGFFESTFNDIVDQNMANIFRHKLLTLEPKN